MNFFKCLFETCKGTAVFPLLLHQSPGRALWHLAMLSLACSLFIVSCSYSGYAEQTASAFAMLENNFGPIHISDKRISATHADKDKSLLLADNRIRVNYLTSLKNGIPEIDTGEINSGFLWTPTMLTAWFKVASDKFLLIPFVYNAAETLQAVNVERSGIKAYIEKNTSAESPVICHFPQLSWAALEDYCLNMLVALIFIREFGGILLQVLFFVLMFSFLLNLRSRRNSQPLLKYRERFVTGIYASFPPLLVATVFRAFELPYLSFDTVFLIGFSLYLIVVFSRLQLDLDRRFQLPPK
ncbi:MAG: hypothetical protein PHV59_07720 [Victivallales bacterium]|nr:hypothetical protein [Victivallales bacterium]